MKTAGITRTRRDRLTLRIPPAERCLIDRDAEAAGKTRTAFILEAARRAAEASIESGTALSLSSYFRRIRRPVNRIC